MHTNFDPNNAWRKVSSALYRKPIDSKILGTVELDVTELEAWVNEKRRDGLKITLLYPLILLVARALKYEVPELNCYVSRGNIVHRPTVDAQVSVLMKGNTEMGLLRVPNADNMTIADLAEFMNRELHKSRNSDQEASTRYKTLIASIPWPFRGWLLGIIRTITIDWGISLPFWGVRVGGFGSFVLSNIGSVGLDVGYPALLPASNVAMVLIMGSVNTKPAVVDGQIVPRRILNLSTALDHRVVDAQHGGKLFRYLKAGIKNPGVLESR